MFYSLVVNDGMRIEMSHFEFWEMVAISLLSTHVLYIVSTILFLRCKS